MKNCFKKPNLVCVLNTLVGAFFLFFGITKIPQMMSENPPLLDMIDQVFPVQPEVVLGLAWVVILIEVIGGLLVLFKNKFSVKMAQLAWVGFFAITLFGTIGLHIPDQNAGAIVLHVAIMTALGYLIYDSTK